MTFSKPAEPNTESSGFWPPQGKYRSLLSVLRGPQWHIYLLLLILLFLRVAMGVLDFVGGLIVDNSGLTSLLRAVGPAIFYLFNTGGITVIVIMIAFNRKNLGQLHVDSPFIVILLFSAFMVFLREWVSPLGWFAGAALIFLLILYATRSLVFGNTNPLVLRISALVIGLFLACMLFLGNRINMTAMVPTMRDFWLQAVPGSTYEEVIFRGALWMLLLELGLSQGKINLMQTLLFWVSHINYTLVDRISPGGGYTLDFWLIVPLSGLAFGLMVSRTKSLTPSTLTHVLINLLAGLIRMTK